LHAGRKSEKKKPFDLFITSPLNRAQETQAYLKQAQELFTGKRPNSIMMSCLRESAQSFASSVDRNKTYDGQSIEGTAHSSTDDPWRKLTEYQTMRDNTWREKLSGRAKDVKDTLYRIVCGIHRRTGQGKCKYTNKV